MLAPTARAVLTLDASVIQPEAMLGLEQFSHVWLLYYFHENTNSAKQQRQQHVRAKIHPPALGGESIGLFATRSPHRPNPIGLSVARLLEVRADGSLLLGGADLIDGTPVIDVKPYLRHDIQPDARVPPWCESVSAASLIREVRFTPDADAQLRAGIGGLAFYSEYELVRQAIEESLQLDIRSVHRGRGTSGHGQLFEMRFDKLELLFATYETHVEVTKCELTADGKAPQAQPKA